MFDIHRTQDYQYSSLNDVRTGSTNSQLESWVSFSNNGDAEQAITTDDVSLKRIFVA